MDWSEPSPWSKPIECQLYKGSGEDTNNTKKIRVGVTDTQYSISDKIRRELNIAVSEAQTRLWIKFKHTATLKLSSSFSYQDELGKALLYGKNLFRTDQLKLLIEIINTDGTWPSVVGYVMDRWSASKSHSSEGKSKIGEIEETLKQKKKELLDIEKSIKKLDKEKKSLLDKSKATLDDITSLEDQLTKLKLKPQAENSNLTSFLVKAIEQKRAELACPVCLETAETPIFMCQQQHLICSSCQPRVTSCPECREAYQRPRRHRYAERDVEELKKMQEELAKITS